MPNAVVDVDSVDLFKSWLDNFWMSQDVKYDYTVNLACTENRLEYDIESYWKVVVVFQEWYDIEVSNIEAHRSLRLSTSLTWLALFQTVITGVVNNMPMITD